MRASRFPGLGGGLRTPNYDLLSAENRGRPPGPARTTVMSDPYLDLPVGLDHQARQHAALVLWLTNVLLGVLIGTAYLPHLPEVLSVRAGVFVGFGLVSSVATLALVPALVYWLALRFLRRPEAQGVVIAAVGSAFLVVIKVDTVVFRLFRYHFFSSAVFNVAITPGSEDAVHLGGHVWGPISIVVALLTAGQYLLWRRTYRRRLGAAAPKERSTFIMRPTVIWGLILLTVVGVEKSIYATADLKGDRDVNSAAEILPAYPRLRVSRLLDEELGGERGFGIRPKGEPLAYPHEVPEVDPGGERPNVLILVLDSWRSDMLSPEVTPRLSGIADFARRFDNHYSGGNGTRFGVFSMLYGLHGTYWFSVLEERRPPVLFEVLGAEGYELRVYSTASMDFPEFRDTAWVGHEADVFDEGYTGAVWERDLQVAERFGEYLAERREKMASGDVSPFLSFVLLDAAHQPYSSPAGGPFQPAAEQLDYMELAGDDSAGLVERVRNRYRNALYFLDGVVAGTIEALRESGELENTLVIVTGDHGDEFQENGFWGHTSNFTDEQVKVPFLLLGAGVEPGVEERPTSHLDIASTILERLGASPAVRPRWCLGRNLFDPDPERNPVVSGWSHVGILAPDGVYRVRMGGHGQLDVDVFDAHWHPLPDAASRIEATAPLLEALTEECERFLLTEGPN